MANLRCIGCKASLIPEDKSVQFITCAYCRKTNKNPNFKEIAKPTPSSLPNQNFNQETWTNTQQNGDKQPSRNDEFLMPFLTSLLMPRRVRHRRNFRRSNGCGGCGCGCLVIFIIIPLVFSIIAAIAGFLPEIIEIISDLWNQLTSY